jgi:serine/threonine-protein kinase
MKICTQCGTRFSEPVAFCPHDGTPTQELQEAPPADPLLGRVIDGRYRVEKAIGEGGMGIVYQISHAVLGKRMALKVLRGDMAKDADVVQRFMQEAQSATSIGHANIIDISDFGRLPDGSVYFVMEFLDGESLTKLIGRGGSVPAQQAMHIIRQIASALDAAHSRGIVHRDLKPDNIYLVKQGHDHHFVKVLDFGIAKVGGASSKLTKTGMIFGTPHYMSPEQASGQSVDRRTDIYALGVIMYEMFTGKVPFDGDTFMGILSKHMFEPPLPPAQVTGKGLGAIEEVILRSLAKKPDERYGSMAELIDDVDKVAAGGTVPAVKRAVGIAPPSNAYPGGGLARSTAGLADALEPPSRTEMRLGQAQAMQPTEEELPPASRLPMIMVALVALLVVGVGVGGAVFWLTGSPATAATGPTTATPTLPTIPPVPGVPGQPAAATAATATATGAPGAPGAAGTTAPGAPTAPGTPAVAGTAAGTAPAARMIEIASDPVGAEVVIDGVIVGNTPVQLPAPAEGQLVVQVRLRGFEPSSVMVMPTSPDSVRVTLSPVRVASGGGHSSRPPRTSSATAPPPPASGGEPRRTSASSEVVDPWAQ